MHEMSTVHSSPINLPHLQYCNRNIKNLKDDRIVNVRIVLQEESKEKHPCPACSIILKSRRELTNHLRGHNSSRSTDGSGEDEYTCGVCRKILSSASSLDRHVLVHSGERPFKCSYCEGAFTTNGNMNRHMKTAHLSKCDSRDNSYTDSEESSDSEMAEGSGSPPSGEYNNNEVIKSNSPVTIGKLMSVAQKRKCSDEYSDDNEHDNRKHKILLGNSRIAIKAPSLDSPEIHRCPICGKLDFPSNALLEAHLERHHPEYPAKCDPCNLSFKNYRVLNLHKNMTHWKDFPYKKNSKNLRNSVVGFTDLTFTDFSSGKFPEIARAVCEQALHRPVSGETAKFQCTKCPLGFPCSLALEAHEKDCGLPIHQQSSSSGVSDNRRSDEQSTRRNHQDFFSGLDLQNTAAVTEAKEGKDLADIQTIITMTSNPILQSFPRSDASTPEHKINPTPSSSGSSGTASSEPKREPTPEEIAAEEKIAEDFRRMKLKGEFPCRLCPRIFPNLRALKGHNRSHTADIEPGMPYPCNMCPFRSTEKQLLTKHLRSHNGDRPWECSLCNYAFTTKANCERHVRNRHSRQAGQNYKDFINYHATEDPGNPLFKRKSGGRKSRSEMARRSLSYPGEQAVNEDYVAMAVSRPRQNAQEPQRSQYADDADIYARPSTSGLNRYNGIASESQQATDLAARSRHEDDLTDGESSDEDRGSLVSDSRSDLVHQRLEASPIDLNIVARAVAVAQAAVRAGRQEAPLDLSMDVLDLSKRSPGESSEENNAEGRTKLRCEDEPMTEPPDVPGPQVAPQVSQQIYDAANQLLFAQALLQAGSNVHPDQASLEAMRTNALLILSSFGLLSTPGGLLPQAPVGVGMPYMPFGAPIFRPPYEDPHREIMRGLQLTSGGSLVQPSTGGGPFGSGYPQALDVSASTPMTQPSPYPNAMSANLPSKPSASSIDNKPDNSASVKMVLKGGVLMPKQKQRRYRTERPFVCPFCGARFTLRSNMERHVKQQHPHHWSQRPRGGGAGRGRPAANPPTLLPNANISISGQQLSQAFPNGVPKLAESSPSNGGTASNSHVISEQVKYAILASQLKGTATIANKTEENDTDEELVIDEEPNNSEEHEPSTSLLRGTLEGNAHSYQQQSGETKKKVGKQEQREDDIAVDERVQSAVKVKNEPDHEAEDDANYRKTAVRVDVHSPSELCVAELPIDEKGTSERENSPKMEKTEKTDSSPINEEIANADLASVSELVENASQQYQQFRPQYMSDEEGLIASTSGTEDEPASSGAESNWDVAQNNNATPKKNKKKTKSKKKMSAYSMAPNRVICQYCNRAFPWSSSLRRHVLTHTGHKPYKCMFCGLLFTTKSNCDRHLLRKHKDATNGMFGMRNSSSPELPLAPPAPIPTNVTANNSSTVGNANNPSTVNNSSNPVVNNSAMRNVPERPYKCNLCPSSTFSTPGNLKKHKSAKHSRSMAASPITNDQQNSRQNDQSGYESQSSTSTENMDNVRNIECAEMKDDEPVEESLEPMESQEDNEERNENMETESALDLVASRRGEIVKADMSKSRRSSPRSSPSPSDTPFKCHLCDCGFAEREDCLEHIRLNHEKAYAILVDKGALDMDIETPEDHHVAQQQQQEQTSDCEGRRPRIPDYSNRKVIHFIRYVRLVRGPIC